jgi:putative transposase
MPGCFKKAPALPLRPRQRALLAHLVRRPSSTQQHVVRARIILLAGEGVGQQQIVDRLQVDRKTVYHWRTRWVAAQDRLVAVEAEEDDIALSKALLASLSDAPRCGAPATYSAEVICQLIAVACEEPETCGYPVSHWTPQALRLELIRRQIVADISPRQVGRFLKGGRSQTASCAVLGTPSGGGRS